MKLIYIGSGFVGTCSAAVMANFGHEVLVYDNNPEVIKKFSTGDAKMIELVLFEEGLGQLVARHQSHLTFSADYKIAQNWLDDSDAVFICVPTPEKNDKSGAYDLTYFNSAWKDLLSSLKKRNNSQQKKHIVVVNKSTVPIVQAEKMEKDLEKNQIINCGVVSNPEFLVEGQAVKDSFSPERVVVGATKEKDFQVMRQIYQRFYDAPTVNYIETNPAEAAAGKILANYLLFSRLMNTFSVVGRVCEKFSNLQFENIRKILTSDKRIGKWGFYNSLYAGGSCLSKDSLSLAHQLEEIGGGRAEQIRKTLAENLFQLENFYKRASQEAKFKWRGKIVAIMGVAFKRDTNDVRNSGAIEIVKKLIADGVKEIRVYDPMAMTMFQKFFNIEKNKKFARIKYFNNEKEALENTSACLVLTDWPEFSLLGKTILQNCRAPYLVMDGRRIIQPDYVTLQENGFDVIAVGSGFFKAK